MSGKAQPVAAGHSGARLRSSTARTNGLPHGHALYHAAGAWYTLQP